MPPDLDVAVGEEEPREPVFQYGQCGYAFEFLIIRVGSFDFPGSDFVVLVRAEELATHNY